jgi:hypothetical protein
MLMLVLLGFLAIQKKKNLFVMYSCGSEKWELATEEKKYANKFFFF